MNDFSALTQFESSAEGKSVLDDARLPWRWSKLAWKLAHAYDSRTDCTSNVSEFVVQVTLANSLYK